MVDRKYMQLRVSKEEFIQIKKAALDAGLTTEEFLKRAALEKTISRETQTQGINPVKKE